MERRNFGQVRPILRGARTVALEATAPAMMAGAVFVGATVNPVGGAALGLGALGAEGVARLVKRKIDRGKLAALT
ncbi:hypothetical protein HYZ70_03950 [Candidatus Curtissbacteria bacterium]|nr:hypothetical protein [Candidatus Curtissbacteria bacterium]